jgi:malonyl-CoA O-methyltransferase
MSRDPRFERAWLRAAFEAAATRYDGAAAFQREVAERLLERLDLIRLKPTRVLDVGAGTGYCTRALMRRYRKSEVFAIDIAPGMLAAARREAPRFFSRQHFVCGDAERIPSRTDTFDLVFSNLTLQWCADLSAALGELWRVCSPGGLLVFTTLGPDTLRELRQAWALVDHYAHVNDFLDMHVIGDALVAAGFGDVVTDVDRMSRTYPDVLALMRNLKDLGAHNVNRGRPRHLLGRSRIERLRHAYERYRTPAGLPASYEVVFGHAWKPLAPGAVPVHFHDRFHQATADEPRPQ